MKTIRLFDQDSHLYTFEATVLSVDAGGSPDTLNVILDATAFFPEGGGQYPDPGTLAGCPVTDVQEQGGIITHTVTVSHLKGAPHPFEKGTVVKGELDAATRRVRMQNHSGEHIISGIVHRLYGYRNVGFHLGDGDVTLDFDGVLTREQLNAIEDDPSRGYCYPAIFGTRDGRLLLAYCRGNDADGNTLCRLGIAEVNLSEIEY